MRKINTIPKSVMPAIAGIQLPLVVTSTGADFFTASFAEMTDTTGEPPPHFPARQSDQRLTNSCSQDLKPK